ncbi:MAG: QueG-associated DUF1730 domain-containing protein [Bacillota bacterium]
MTQLSLLQPSWDMAWVSGRAPAPEVVAAKARRGPSRAGGLTPFVPGDGPRRWDVRTALPGCRGIFMIAIPFGSPDYRPGPFLLSQSSWGPDYHRIIPPLLRALVARDLGERAARQASIQVDSGPLEERALGLAMGLGRLGKNASLIVPGLGSKVFLGVALTTEVPSVRRLVDDADGFHPACEGCELCLTACPSGALGSPGTVNGLRCLSYVSQKRGFLPDDLARRLGGRLYGCDECTEACPLNDIDEGLVTPFGGTERDRNPDPRAVLTSSESTYGGRWRGKAGSWRGRRVLERNCINALGWAGVPGDVGLLCEFLDHPSPALRAASLRSIGAATTRHGMRIPGYATRLLRDRDHRVRFAAKKLLASS